MSAAHLAAVTTIAQLRAVHIDGTFVIGRRDELARRFEAEGAGLSGLLAEPVLGERLDGGIYVNASWYTDYPGTAVSLTELPADQRSRAEAALRDALARLRAIVDDPKAAALLARALLVPSLDDVLFVDGRPVLRNWGFVPASAAADGESLYAHFEATLGRFCDYGTLLWPSDLRRRHDLASAEPAPKPRWFERHAVLAAIAAAVVAAWTGLAWHDLDASGRLGSATPTRAAALDGEIDRLAGRHATLQRQLAGDVCTLDRPQGGPQVVTAPDPPPPPPPPPSPPPAGAYASPPASMAQHLERSAAFILVITPPGVRPEELLGTGTGFFIAKNLLVTNRHVVQDTRNRLLVTSAAMGDVREARAAVVSKSDEFGEPDFAVVRLARPFEDAEIASVRSSIEKLERVYTAGYPGFISLQLLNLPALLNGRRGAMPEMTLTAGEVSLVQPQANAVPIVIHTADISEGSSGGPLVDACGRVVGVNTFGAKDDQSGRRLLASLGGTALVAFLKSNNIGVRTDDRRCRTERGGPP